MCFNLKNQIMKLQKLFIAILFIGTLFSCSNDDDTNTNLVGTWTLTDVRTFQETSSSSTGTMTAEGIGSNYDGGVTFTENPNEYTANTTYDMEVTTSVDGNVQDVLNYDNISALGNTGTWSLNGDQLSTTENGITSNFTISFSDNGNTLTMVGGGGNVAGSATVTSTLHRQ